MSVLSTRLSLQWPPAAAYEDTDTLVLTSNDAHFVDIRVFKDHKTSTNPVPIDWVLTGKEHVLKEYPLSIEFQHEINTHADGNTGGPFDSGDFEDLEGGDRKETGNMLNIDTGVKQDYVEIWRSIDPLKSTPNEYVLKLDPNGDDVKVLVLKVKHDGYLGTVVRIGNFLQGALLNRHVNKYSVLRYYLKDDEWSEVFQYGDEFSKIPIISDGEVSKIVEARGLKWEIVESN